MWAGWRADYVSSGAVGDVKTEGEPECVMCEMISDPAGDEANYVVWRGASCLAVLNAFPYTSGHLMVLPTRHVGEMERLGADESQELWSAMTKAVVALKGAYDPQGVNVGINLGRAAGAGIPGHLHVHALPRWNGDTSFMTAVAEVRVLPETLGATREKLRGAWPQDL
ncbi:MAG: HIT family protein [Acidimicrobiales bacterium]